MNVISHPSLWWLAILLYIVPALRLLATLLRWRAQVPQRIWSAWCVRVEWMLSVWRDFVGLIAWSLFGVATIFSWCGIISWPCAAPLRWLWPLPIALSLWARADVQRHRVALLWWLGEFPTMSPQDFFGAYFAGFGVRPMSLAMPPQYFLQWPCIDFRTRGRPWQGSWPLWHYLFSTIFIASLILQTARDKHLRPHVRHIFDALQLQWGARILQLGHLALTIEGVEHLQTLDDIALFCGTHTSLLDMIALPIATGLVVPSQRGAFHVRFMAAADHFRDNWLLFSLLKIGRAMQAAEMIFVHRHGEPLQRQRAITQAVRQLVESGVDLSIYPQGTRAPGRCDAHGVRVEPGYFTTGGKRRLVRVGGHLKTGAARIALATARALALQQPPRHVSCVPVALLGGGIAVPRETFRLQTETLLTLRIGAPLRVPVTAGDDESAVAHFHAQLDAALQSTHGITQRLIEWVRAEPSLQKISCDALAEWMHENSEVVATVDCLYQLPSAVQPALLQRLLTCATTKDLDGVRTLYQAIIAQW